MNINKNLKYNNASMARMFNSGLMKKSYYNSNDFFKSADSFSVINDTWQYNIDQTNEIVSNIANATKPYAYNTGNSKWYVKNNLNNYEQYGIMPTVQTLEGVTTYTGKLVVLSTDSHEYKWNGSEWVDLGGYIQTLDYVTIDDGNPGLKYPNVVISSGYKIQTKMQCISGQGQGQFVGCLKNDGSDLPDNNDFRIFFYGYTSIMYDCGNSRKQFNIAAYNTFEHEYGLYYAKDLTTGNYLFNNGTKTLSLSSDAMFWIGRKVDFGFNMYYCKVYDNNNNLLLNLVPDEQNGIYGFKNLVDNTFNGRAGITGHYVGVVPEQYPEKPAPALSQTKTSYNNVLSGNYLNGQTVRVYNNTYTVTNGKLTN